MLAIEQVEKYAGQFKRYSSPEMFGDFSRAPEYRLRLGYKKDNQLCRLSMIDTIIDYVAFTDFVNREEALTETMLIRPDAVHLEGRKLGTHKMLRYGKVIGIDVQAGVQAIRGAIMEASKVF